MSPIFHDVVSNHRLNWLLRLTWAQVCMSAYVRVRVRVRVRGEVRDDGMHLLTSELG